MHAAFRAALAALAVAVATACAADPTSSTGRATVVRAVDGDTLVVRLGGHDTTVRLLGIDTPETVHPTRPAECFGAEASARLAALLPPGTAVRLERDVEATDRYRRVLAYVHRVDDDLFVNLDLVRSGHAVAAPHDPNRAHRPDLSAAEAEARAAGVGLWAGCGGADTALTASDPTPDPTPRGPPAGGR